MNVRDHRIIARCGEYFIPAAEVREGDLLDLENDSFADPSGDGFYHHGTDFNGGNPIYRPFEFEFARVVEPPVRETAECVLIHTDQGSFGFPPDHQIETTLDNKGGTLRP